MGISRISAALALTLAFAAPASAQDDPSPPGSNDWACKPSAEHPRPVVLAHGLGANQSGNWRSISPAVKAAGFCVFSLTYGVDPRWQSPGYTMGGTIDMRESAVEFGAFVDRVLAATGAEQVDLLGHSEGTMMPRWWLKFLGGAPKVHRYVAMTPLWRGTEAFGGAILRDLAGSTSGQDGEAFVGEYCEMCMQALRGSDYLNAVNAGGEAAPGVLYTSLVTRYDELVIPYTSGIMDSPQATNIVVQDVCPTNVAEHVAMAFDPVTLQLILNALDPAHSKAPPCRATALPRKLKRL